ncbi:MAG TPA: SirB1 family protein [Candidatus Luteimonas excrementigallinarum]|nr:SirB1 family protein [Candidatus Luteimonas excrementigallinarum]
MTSELLLPAWNTLASLDDADIPLLGTALLIARDEYPDLEPRCYEQMLAHHVEQLRPRIEAIDPWPMRMLAINEYLFDELGYSGNHEEYYDPRNSYLNEVFERRLGIPISLAVVQIEVARRLDMPLEGISFPGHFLVRLPVDDGMLVMDPFNRGRPLDAEELRERIQPHLSGTHIDDQALHQVLNPASHRSILMRMLRNLHGLYAQEEDWARAVRCADRILSLAPDNPAALRDRGMGYLHLGHRHGARVDLGRYLTLDPDADDASQVHESLADASSGSARLN